MTDKCLFNACKGLHVVGYPQHDNLVSLKSL